MEKTDLVDEFVKIELEDFTPIEMDDSLQFDCIWTNNILSQTVNEYITYETKIDEQKLVSHPEEFDKYQQSNEENVTDKYICDQNEDKELDQLLKEFQTTTKEYDIVDYIDDPNMSLQHDDKIEEASTSYQHPSIVAEQCQPSTSQILTNPQAECANNVLKTTVESKQQRSEPLFRYEIFPVVADGNTIKYDCIQTIVAYESAVKPKISHKRTRIKYNEEHLMVLKKKFAEDPYPTIDYFEEMAIKWNLKPNQIKVWFQNERKMAKVAGAPTAKPLKAIRYVKPKKFDSKPIEPQHSNFDELTDEVEPPRKKRTIESNLVAMDQNNIALDCSDNVSRSLMPIDNKSNGSDRGFYSSDQEIVQERARLQEQMSDNSYFSSISDEFNEPWEKIHPTLMKYVL